MMYPYIPALEAIDHQVKTVLFNELISAITDLQKLKRVGDIDIHNSGISDIIKKHTGLATKVSSTFGITAYVFVPEMGKNNIMHSLNSIYSDKDIDAIISKRGMFVGVIDLKKGKVTGAFEDFFSEIVLGDALLHKGSMFTPEETAAIILHEVGHVFTIMEMIIRYSKTNYVLQSGMQRILDSQTKEQRIQVLRQIENLYDEEIPDLERIAEIKKHPDYYRTIILTLAAKDSFNQLGVNLYDLRGFEQLADQFASRQGAGLPLATGLDKIYRYMGDMAYYSTPAYYLMLVVQCLSFVFLTFFSFGLFALILAAVNYNLYDPIPKRLDKIKADAIDALKDRNIEEKRRKELVDNIEIMNQLMDEMKDRDDFYKFVWNELTPWGRRQRKEIVFNEQLERMLNNSLYHAAARLKSN